MTAGTPPQVRQGESVLWRTGSDAAPLALNHADHPRFVIPSSFVISIFVILEYPFVIYLAAPNFLAFDLRTCPATSTNSAKEQE